MFAAACKETAKAPLPAPVTTPDKIVVGATLPISSREGLTARFYQEGYALAFDEVNSKGGLQIGGKKVPLVLEILDDADDPAKGVEKMRTLLEARKASFLLGSSSPKVVEAQSAIADREGVPYLTAAGDKALFERGYRWLFGLQAPFELLAYTQMRWIDEQQKANRLPTPLAVALLVEDGARGKEFRKGVVEFTDKTPSRRASYRVVFDESFPPDERDFTPRLARLKAAGADAFFADATLSEFLVLHKQYLAQRLCHKVISYGARGGEPDAVEAFGYDNLAWILSAVWWSNRIAKGGLAQHFVESFKDSYHRDPDWYGALPYEAARALIAAIGAVGADREAVRNQLATSRIESILPGGRLMFGAGQQAIYPFVVQQNQPDGKSPVVYPNDVAESPGQPSNPKCRPSSK
jgi:branched-chain amino acid transport system substrate-binding protein